jgi:hypothetical protein
VEAFFLVFLMFFSFYVNIKINCIYFYSEATVAGLFRDQVISAFSSIRFIFSLWAFISYFYSGFLCVKTKVYILFGLSVVAFVTVIFLEIIIRKNRAQNDEIKREKVESKQEENNEN